MIKPSSFTCSAAASLLLLLAVGSGNAAEDCEERLGDKLYRCEIAVADSTGNTPGGSSEGCVAFQATPDVPSQFNLLLLATGGPGSTQLLCSCKASGNVKNPKFDDDKDFICGSGASLTNSQGFISFEGAVKGDGNKIKDGHLFIAGEGTDEQQIVATGVFECRVDPSCATPTLTLAPPGTTP